LVPPARCFITASLPAGERGLKLFRWLPVEHHPKKSLPAGERGLKLAKMAICPEMSVAPRRGAWIEIIQQLTGGWIPVSGRSPQGSVD